MVQRQVNAHIAYASCSPLLLSVIAAGIIFLVEFLLMLALQSRFPGVSLFVGLCDALMVAVVAALPLYLLLIRPLHRALHDRAAAVSDMEDGRRHLETLMANFPGMAYRCQGDTETLLFVSDGCRSLTGYQADELVGASAAGRYTALIYPRDRERVQMTRTLAVQHGLPFQIEYRIGTDNETAKWVWEQGCGVKSLDGELLEVDGFITDVTEWKHTHELLKKSRDYYLSLFESFPALIWRANPAMLRDYFNAAWLTFAGEELDEMVGEGWMAHVHPEDLDRCLQVSMDAFADQQAFQVEYRLRRHDDEYRWVIDFGHPYYSLEGEFAGYIGSGYDITEQKHLEEKLSHQATHDALTGLPNRRVFEETALRAITRARHGATSAILFMDVDHFKTINDSFGHAAGDDTLQAVARAILARLRGGDVLARVGGDEFAILLAGVGLPDGRIIANRIADAVRALPYPGDDGHRHLSLSIGLVPIAGDQDYATLMQQVDAAMYQAKAQGRDCVVCVGELAISAN